MDLARLCRCAATPLHALTRPAARTRLRWPITSTSPSTSSSLPSAAVLCPPPPRRALHVRSSLLLKKKVLSSPTSTPPKPAPPANPTSPATPPSTSTRNLPPPRFFQPSSPQPPLPSIRSIRNPNPPYSPHTPHPTPPHAQPLPPRTDPPSFFHPDPLTRTRKLRDNPDDPAYDWRVGMLIERLPRVLNRQLAAPPYRDPHTHLL